MFTRLQRLLGIKDTAVSLMSDGKALLDNAKAAYDDIKQDGIGMDDLAKAQKHFTDIKAKATNLASKTTSAVKQVKTDTSEAVAVVKKTTTKTKKTS